MQSRQQLVLRALQELGVAAAGQTPSAEDAAVVDAEVEPMFTSLAEREVWQWGDPDEIADGAFLHLAKWLANSVAQAFGGTFNPDIELLAEQNLRALKPVYLSGQPQKTSYY